MAFQTKQLRQLMPDILEQLVCISGMIIRVSPVIPLMTTAVFRCVLCGNIEVI